MNSKQRRADRKEWRYEVTIDEGKSFADYDAMFDWCVTNFGNGRGIKRNGWRKKTRPFWHLLAIQQFRQGHSICTEVEITVIST
jgi:hypothetical protein